MTTKSPLRKQVIVPISNNNKAMFIKDSCSHVSNLNRTLKNIKSNTMVDYICQETVGIVIITNKVALDLKLQTIEKYIKNMNYIKAEKVNVPQLPQSKSYLKITGILYLREDTNTPITSDMVEDIIKKNYIFNNIVLASKPQIIKVFLKSDIAIIWINIWDVQGSNKVKELINRYFNVSSFIAIIQDVNMNSGIPQCKNCYKWDHATFSCRVQGAKCVKCNRSHKTEHHHYYAWCYKDNSRTNPLRLETKQGKLYPHSFKYLNCQGDHQADSNLCSF